MREEKFKGEEEEEVTNKPPEVLYKYRSIDNWKFFVDILLNNRLYAAKYKDLNDPMEGGYYYHSGKLDKKTRDKLREGKEKLKICALSATDDNFLMWSHYANGHQGVAIGVEVDKKYDICEIEYDGQTFVERNSCSESSAKEILAHKSKIWNYENEWRVFTEDDFINVNVREIVIGKRMNDKDKELVKKLVTVINSKRKSKIIINIEK
ncbi:MAG: DUF2971 domain-containing protein [Candidatus Symbiothrix sp.]|jgi:hypothetical protein|nr:DUF2971 domain-containing protein [Candidatus Symbiothrix sp.]